MKITDLLKEGEVVAFPKKHKGDLSRVHSCPKCGGDLQGGKYQGHEVKVCMPCKQVYLPPNSGIDHKGDKVVDEIAGAFPSPSTRAKWAADAAVSNAAEAKRQAALKAQADAERLKTNTELVDKEQKVNYHSLSPSTQPPIPANEGYKIAEDGKGYKSPTGGLTQKGRDHYNRTTGSHLQAPVTKKPSELKAGSKAANRRKSFCARMSGNKGPMKKPNGEPTRKALALRKWNCESVEEMRQLIEHATQVIAMEKFIAEGTVQYQVVCDGTKKGIFTDKDAAIANAKSMFKHEKEYYHIAVVDLSTKQEVWSWSKKSK